MSNYELHRGDCLEVLRTMPDNSIDAIVTDPPYGLSKEPDMAEVLKHWLAGDDYVHKGKGFMGKSWDSFVPGPAVWRECLRVLKPGGHLVSFFGTRTYDMGVLAIRLAGFEVRDQLAWVYGSGFPKSQNVSKAIDKAGSSDPLPVARALEGIEHTTLGGERVFMRREDHQLFQPLQISVHTDEGIEFDGDNSGFGLRTEESVPLENTLVETTCKMTRPQS